MVTLITHPLAKLFILLISTCLYQLPSIANQFITADNKHFSYTGRIDFANRKAPLISFPGTSIKANFTGSHLSLVLDDQKGKNFYSVIIDGDDHSPYVIQAKLGLHTYVINQALSEGPHSLEIYKRTEGEEGSTLFKGIEIADSAKLLAPPQRPSRKIEVYGDSISSGMGNEAAHNGADHLASEKNNYWAYGSITARNLNAELHTISQSGIGVMVSWFDFIMPEFYDQLDASGNNDSQWNFKQWTPDVVVINLMQNDRWLIENEKRLQPEPNENQRIAAYQQFVTDIRSKYPTSQIICALGSMDATKTDKWPNYVRHAVSNMQKSGDDKIDYIFFEYTGYGAHPRIAQHKANAKKLTKFIAKLMHW